MTDQEIRDLFGKFNVALSDDDIWFVQRNPVVKHQALERLGAAMRVEWADVQFVHITDKSAVIMVRGKRNDNAPADEWSTGEAVIGQNYQVSGKQAAYPVAMAEKRAKDRVILKLARLYGVYSEDEADEFNNAAPSRDGSERQPEAAEQDGGERIRLVSPPSELATAPNEIEAEIKRRIDKARSINAVTDLMLNADTQRSLQYLAPGIRDEVRDYAKARLQSFGWPGKKGA